MGGNHSNMVGNLQMSHVVLIVIGSVVFLFSIVIICYCCKYKSRQTGKERKRYVYKYDPFTGKGNVAVIMELSTSNGGVIQVERPENTSKTKVSVVDCPLKKERHIDRQRSQSFTETRYVYRYNPMSGEGSVEQIPAIVDTLAVKRPKSSRSHNCLAVDVLEHQLYRKAECCDNDHAMNVLRKIGKHGSDSRSIDQIGQKISRKQSGDVLKVTKHERRSSTEGRLMNDKNAHMDDVRSMKTRAGGKKSQHGVHHVLLSSNNSSKPPTGLHGSTSHSHSSHSSSVNHNLNTNSSKRHPDSVTALPPTVQPQTGLPPTGLSPTGLPLTSLNPDGSDSSSVTTNEISRSTSDLHKLLDTTDSSDGTVRSNGGNRKKRNSPKRSRSSVGRSSVGEIFPPSARSNDRYRRKSHSSRVGLLTNHTRGSEGYIFTHRRKASDSTPPSVDGDEEFNYRTLSLTSLTQSMWQREYETTAHESQNFIPEGKEDQVEMGDINENLGDCGNGVVGGECENRVNAVLSPSNDPDLDLIGDRKSTNGVFHDIFTTKSENDSNTPRTAHIVHIQNNNVTSVTRADVHITIPETLSAHCITDDQVRPIVDPPSYRSLYG